MTDQEHITIDEEQNDITEVGDRDSTGEQVEAIQIKELRTMNTEAYIYSKSPVKLKNKCSLEPFSITSIILFSVLFGIVGAGKLKSVSGNEILKGKPAWANSRMEQKNHEDLLINAFDCMDDNLPSTQISLRPPPKKC